MTENLGNRQTTSKSFVNSKSINKILKLYDISITLDKNWQSYDRKCVTHIFSLGGPGENPLENVKETLIFLKFQKK